MAAVARRLSISGRVQGVFYRAWTVETARELGLVGWVRNRPDGSVEAHVQGEAAAVDRLVALARRGPTAARVDAVHVTETPAIDLVGFEKRPTG
ncbi:MAG: acylphosphatase [Sphingobium sp.]|nr:acylphosphatase [Sphingobium sp.]